MKRKRYLLLILAIAAAFMAAPLAQAQRKLKVERPDLEQIKKETLDPKSRFYYPKLRQAYLRQDTVMTPEQYRYYYLGAMFQEDYDPYRHSVYSDSLEYLLDRNRAVKQSNDSTLKARMARKESQFELTRLNRELSLKTLREQRDIVAKAKLALDDNPFDLESMYMLFRLYEDMKKDMSAKIWRYRFENIIGAILSTGDGKTAETAWYVISPDHEYVLLQLSEYAALEADFVEPGYDYLKVRDTNEARARRGNSPEGFYFDVITPIAEYMRRHPEEAEGDMPREVQGEEIILTD